MSPTVGRILWYWQHPHHGPSEQPQAAIVTYVHSDTLVNIVVLPHQGAPIPRTSIPIGAREGGNYCEWPVREESRPILSLKKRA